MPDADRVNPHCGKSAAVRREEPGHLAAGVLTPPATYLDDLVSLREQLAEINDGLRSTAAYVDTGNQGAAGVLNRAFAGARSSALEPGQFDESVLRLLGKLRAHPAHPARRARLIAVPPEQMLLVDPAFRD